MSTRETTKFYLDFPNYNGNPASPYFDHIGSSTLAGYHGVCICGYHDNANPGGSGTDHQGGFKMVNFWGPSWNGNGFVYLSNDLVKRYVREAWSMGDLSPDGLSITSVSPSVGGPGTSVTINGNNFGTLRRQAKVSFNGVSATSPTFTNASITATVPTGATTGPLTVYDCNGKPSNSVTFTVSASVVCGQSAGASVSVLAVAFGLVSLAGLGLRRKRK